MINKAFATATLATTLLLAGCSDSSQDDVHSAPRETQAWENVDLSGYDQAQLLAHLNRLAGEATTAAAAGQSIEFHHLEVAITPTLEALEATAEGKESALETIAVIKDLAVKLHIAGHDGNVKIGTKLSAKITELSAKLATEL